MIPDITLPHLTDRLRLRRPEIADTAAVFEYQRLEQVAAYLYRGPSTEEQVRAKLSHAATAPFAAAGDDLLLLVERRDAPGVVGEVVLKWAGDVAKKAEVGYTFNPAHGGYGYATEAARAMLRIGFETVGFHRIYARLDEENTASAKVCQRLGMRQEARLVESDVRLGQWGTELVYAMLDREWAALTAIESPAEPPT